MAAIFQIKLPQYASQKPLKFSVDQLNRFKHCYYIEKYCHYRESVAVNQKIVENKLNFLREKFEEYKSENVYNIDESAFFQKMSPEKMFATKQISGDKHDKA